MGLASPLGAANHFSVKDLLQAWGWPACSIALGSALAWGRAGLGEVAAWVHSPEEESPQGGWPLSSGRHSCQLPALARLDLHAPDQPYLRLAYLHDAFGCWGSSLPTSALPWSVLQGPLGGACPPYLHKPCPARPRGDALALVLPSAAVSGTGLLLGCAGCPQQSSGLLPRAPHDLPMTPKPCCPSSCLVSPARPSCPRGGGQKAPVQAKELRVCFSN